MEKLKRNLRDFIQEKIPFNNRLHKLKIIKDIISGIDYLHSKNIIHLDLKPANIMLDEKNTKAVIIDFGISKFLLQD